MWNLLFHKFLICGMNYYLRQTKHLATTNILEIRYIRAVAVAYVIDVDECSDREQYSI